MRTDQARNLDAGLFRGTALAPMETALGSLGFEAIIVGGCCELNTTTHRLIIDIGAQLGVRAATASGEDANQCVERGTGDGRQECDSGSRTRFGATTTIIPVLASSSPTPHPTSSAPTRTKQQEMLPFKHNRHNGIPSRHTYTEPASPSSWGYSARRNGVPRDLVQTL